MEGRIGSTNPMPMNETTQAKATAKTAFGCLNGLAAPVDVPLIQMLRFGMSAAPGPSGPRWLCSSRPCSSGLAHQRVITLGAGQGVHGRQGRDQRGLLVRTEPGQQRGDPLGPHGPAAGQYGLALGRDT